MSQTTIREFQRARFPGMRYDMSGTRDRTGIIEGDADTRVPFGIFVKRGAADRGIALLAALGDADLLAGMIPHGHAFERFSPGGEIDDAGLLAKVVTDVVEKGRIALLNEQTVTPEDPVFVRVVATEEFPITGTVRKDADGGTAIPLYGARFFESATVIGDGSGDGSVPVDFDLPAYLAGQKAAALVEAP